MNNAGDEARLSGAGELLLGGIELGRQLSFDLKPVESSHC